MTIPSGPLRYVDWQLANLMARLGGGISESARQLVAELSHSLSLQHSCLPAPDIDSEILAELTHCGLLSEGEEKTPLVIQGEYLYLHRYWQYESRVAQNLLARNQALAVPTPNLTPYFDLAADPHQRDAALHALTHQLTIITGGPGTGKTSTVARILALLAEQQTAPDVALAAPTGKAAMRLAESTRSALSQIAADTDTLNTEVKTLHRLLGVRRDRGGFRHHRGNPLVLDLLIVDEVSMIDLSMMYHLLEALPASTRLILLGDQGQLPSVETGNVLADLCHPGNRLGSAICHLHHSFRFSDERGIGRLAEAVRSAAAADVPMADSDDGEVSFHATAACRDETSLLRSFSRYLDELDEPPLKLLRNFDRCRVLCATREGEYGVTALNEAVEALLEQRSIKTGEQRFYHGRPVMISRNDYRLGLFNGDVGICIEDDGQMFVVFPNGPGDVRRLLASRLPEHETCFAMTVHKSQGSEFDEVMLVLATGRSEKADQLLGRELVYTAITRARDAIRIYTDASTWQHTVTHSSERVSGLHQFLDPVNSAG